MPEIHESDVFALLTDVRKSLDTDGYDLELLQVGDVIELAVRARPDMCEDCLVGKPVMRSIIADAIGEMYEDVTADAIVLHYPTDAIGTV